MFKGHWNDRTPARRCDWIDQLRGWAVLLMIEVHVVNVWLRQGMLPDWLNYVNGLVAPSFILCAGFSLGLAIFKPTGGLRPFGRSGKRLSFLMVCAYALHAPGLTLASWVRLDSSFAWRTFLQIDVLQCIVISLLILHGLARVLRRPEVFAVAALGLALGVALAAPFAWCPGVGDGWVLPVRGLINGNMDQGVASLFPLFPWFSFAAIGATLGVTYRHLRVIPQPDGLARWSETRWLLALALIGGISSLWGSMPTHDWLDSWAYPANHSGPFGNSTLPSVARRLGNVCLVGAFLGALEGMRGCWPGPNGVQAVGRESLLVYMLHLNLIFGLLMMESIQSFTGWRPHSQGWLGTLALTGALIALNLMAALAWQRVRQNPWLTRMIHQGALAVLGVWFLAGGWIK